MTIELVVSLFDYGTTEAKRLIRLFRDEIFETFASSNQSGLIFTVACNFDDPDQWARIKEVSDIFSNNDAEVCLVELEADTQVHIARNENSPMQALPSSRTKEKKLWPWPQLLFFCSAYGGVSLGAYALCLYENQGFQTFLWFIPAAEQTGYIL